VGFIQRLPTHLIAAFRATLEEIADADILLHVADVTNDAWRKQEASVLKELHDMGLSNKRVVTVWNKIDLVPERASYLKQEAERRTTPTVCVSAMSGEGLDSIVASLTQVLEEDMLECSLELPYEDPPMLAALHSLASLREIDYENNAIKMRGRVPIFLYEQLVAHPGVTVYNEKNEVVVERDSRYTVKGAAAQREIAENTFLQKLQEKEFNWDTFDSNHLNDSIDRNNDINDSININIDDFEALAKRRRPGLKGHRQRSDGINSYRQMYVPSSSSFMNQSENISKIETDMEVEKNDTYDHHIDKIEIIEETEEAIEEGANIVKTKLIIDSGLDGQWIPDKDE